MSLCRRILFGCRRTNNQALPSTTTALRHLFLHAPRPPMSLLMILMPSPAASLHTTILVIVQHRQTLSPRVVLQARVGQCLIRLSAPALHWHCPRIAPQLGLLSLLPADLTHGERQRRMPPQPSDSPLPRCHHSTPASMHMHMQCTCTHSSCVMGGDVFPAARILRPTARRKAVCLPDRELT